MSVFAGSTDPGGCKQRAKCWYVWTAVNPACQQKFPTKTHSERKLQSLQKTQQQQFTRQLIADFFLQSDGWFTRQLWRHIVALCHFSAEDTHTHGPSRTSLLSPPSPRLLFGLRTRLSRVHFKVMFESMFLVPKRIPVVSGCVITVNCCCRSASVCVPV